MGLNVNDRVQKEPVTLSKKAECFNLIFMFLELRVSRVLNNSLSYSIQAKL